MTVPLKAALWNFPAVPVVRQAKYVVHHFFVLSPTDVHHFCCLLNKTTLMRARLISVILLTFFCSGVALSQTQQVHVTGRLIDKQDQQPLPFANVALRSLRTEKVLASTTADVEGHFSIRTDSADVYLEIRLIGYDDYTLKTLSGAAEQNLGDIPMSSLSQNLTEVEVTAERSTVEFQTDKRVFHVGADISNTGMGALDVLNNVPSVNVDIEGQVRLRGNTGVRILINGKPSVLADEQGNALSTITADMIERVEVITNPSAKYEAEGTSGIINIVLKKEEKKGLNGSVSLNTGYPNNHSVGGSINYRTESFNFFTQFGAGYRTRPRYSRSTSQSASDSLLIESNGENFRNEEFYNITLGTDYYIDDWNTITLSGNFAYEIESQPSETEFSIYDKQGVLISDYTRLEETSALNPKWQYDLQYARQFEDHEDHQLLFSTLGSFFGKDQSSEFTNEIEVGGNNLSNQQTRTDFYQADYTFKLDYTNPISELFKIETGALYQINNVGNDFGVYDRTGSVWTIDSSLSNDFTYVQKVLGVYGTGTYETEEWGVKIGLRAENTELLTRLENTSEENYQNYTNLFPSIHTHYKWTSGFSVQAGYSRRIFRPRLWDLNPFFNISNNYNVRTGNPNLQPEFADSYELTGIFIRDKFSVNAGIYYIYTTDVVESVSRYENNVNITMPINVGTRDKVGVEVNGKYDVASWFNLWGDFNYGYFSRNAVYDDRNISFTGAQWNGRISTKFKLPADFEFELTSNYQSGYETIQGDVSGYAFFDAGLRKKVMNGKIVMSLGVRDMFAGRIRESVIQQSDYYLYNFSQRGAFLTFGISYGFGKGEAMSYSGGRHR